MPWTRTALCLFLAFSAGSLCAHDVAAKKSFQTLPSFVPSYVSLKLLNFKQRLAIGEMKPEIYASGIRRLMKVTARLDRSDLGQSKMMNLENFAQLALAYEELDESERRPDLESEFIRSFGEVISEKVKAASTMVGLFMETNRELGSSGKYWVNEEARERWQQSPFYLWSGFHWRVVESLATDSGKVLLKSSSALTERANREMMELREFIPDMDFDPQNDVLPVRMVVYAKTLAFVHFGEEVDDYLNERGSFLGYKKEIESERTRACRVILDDI